MRPFLLKKNATLLACALVLFLTGCQKHIADLKPVRTGNSSDGIIPYSFNWETVDWMPTPPGQSQISPPWVGQGSMASTFGAEIANDHRSADGWEMIYNTFDPNASGPLVNPYFMLYNRYRGLLRVYFYVTTPFTYPSTYLVDGLNMVSTQPTTMFQFLGTNYVDASQHPTSYTQIEPAPQDGSAPLASSKWYMLQYELAYDPNVSTLTDQSQISWFTNYNSVTQVSLGGSLTGTIKSPVTGAGPGLSNAIRDGGTAVGTTALGLIGTAIFNNNGNASTGVNTLGLPEFMFKDISSGLTSALSGGVSKLPSAIAGVLSALVGGSSASSTVNLEVNCSVNLQGTQTTKGSFPSSPSSVYIPGSQISPLAQNYLPLQSHALGLWGLTAKPRVYTVLHHNPDANGYYLGYFYLDQPIDQVLALNPYLSDPVKGASIENLQALIILPQFLAHDIPDPETLAAAHLFNTTGHLEKNGNNTAVAQYADGDNEPVSFNIWYYRDLNLYTGPIGVRVSFDVVPFNGAPKVQVVKTFDAEVILNNVP